jgi:hypothetical protein
MNSKDLEQKLVHDLSCHDLALRQELDGTLWYLVAVDW